MARQKATIRREVITTMKNLGVYQPDYNLMINIFVNMLHQLEVFTDQFEASGYSIEEEHTNKAGMTNMKKRAVYGAMEKLRMDISSYSTQLCITPKALGLITDSSPKMSALDKVFHDLTK